MCNVSIFLFARRLIGFSSSGRVFLNVRMSLLWNCLFLCFAAIFSGSPRARSFLIRHSQSSVEVFGRSKLPVIYSIKIAPVRKRRCLVNADGLIILLTMNNFCTLDRGWKLKWKFKNRFIMLKWSRETFHKIWISCSPISDRAAAPVLATTN